MNVSLNAPKFKKSVQANPSKSEAHRTMICAALSKTEVRIPCPVTNEDIKATARCLEALGAKISYENGVYTVSPLNKAPNAAECDCGESGTTLRFMIPLCAALGCKTTIKMHGRLPERPLSPLDTMLANKGISVKRNGDSVTVDGNMPKNEAWAISGEVSSQFISGMLFALTAVGGTLEITGKTESKPYIDMTKKTLLSFGADIYEGENSYTVKSSVPLSATAANVGGDWSGAAFPIVIGVTGNYPVTVTGIQADSTQGDKEIVAVLQKMGARITVSGDSVTAYPSALKGITVDCAHIPDLIPVLAVAALKAEGKTEFINAARLRLKESDRLTATANLITALGGKVEEKPDGLTVYKSEITGRAVKSEKDHRIAMAAAVAACFAKGEVTVLDAECVSKSYPNFWEEFEVLK